MINKLLSFLLICMIRIYQTAVSPWLGKNCRFIPTCSEYAIDAIKTQGAIMGTYFAFKRIFKCHPFHPGGVDKPPE